MKKKVKFKCHRCGKIKEGTEGEIQWCDGKKQVRMFFRPWITNCCDDLLIQMQPVRKPMKARGES